MGTLADKVVVITGGSSGIGRATALAFADAGAHVLATARGAEALDALAGERLGICTLVADAADAADAFRTIAAAVDRWGRVDVLVNNAGAGAVMPVAAADEAKIKDIFAVNVVSPSLLASAALPLLAAVGGSIVNVSSSVAQRPAAGISHYAAAKAALEHLTRCWALELAPQKVRVNAVAVSPVETNALAGMFGLPQAQIDIIKARERETIPLGRRGDPDDVSRWIMALADPHASWVTGAVMAVDGGLALI